MSGPPPVARDLEAVLGEDAVLWAPEDLLVYEYDATIDRGAPQAIAFPSSADDVVAILGVARTHGLPVTPRGAGTGLSGGALAVRGGIIIAMNRMRRILSLDAEARTALVEPGVVNLELGQEAARHGLAYAPDPSSQRACTIGGNIAENAGGPHTLALGTTTNHVLGVEFVDPTGAVHWLGGPTRDTPGYDLVGCVVGSEGTLGIVTKALVRLVPAPESVNTFLGIYDSVRQASNAVSAIVQAGIVPAALEMIDRVTIAAVEPVLKAGFPLDADAILLVEVDGPALQVAAEGEIVEDVLRQYDPREIRTATEPQGPRTALGRSQGCDQRPRPHQAQLLPAGRRRAAHADCPTCSPRSTAWPRRTTSPSRTSSTLATATCTPACSSTSASRASPIACWRPAARSCGPASTPAARSAASTASGSRSARTCPGSSATTTWTR